MGEATYHSKQKTGFLWLGDVPAHWDLLPLGSCFRERREKVSDKDFAPLSVTKNGIVPQLDHAAKTDDNDNRKKVLSGDMVINSRSDRRGSSGMASSDGSVSLINTVLAPGGRICGRFAHHLLRSVNFQEEFYRVGKGIVADLWSTNYAEMKRIRIAVPPIEEQQAIARFLDRETSKIDALVSEQRRLIALLKEKRQAVISHAVTKGLNPAVPMKPSGIPWLGDVPKHWEVKRVKHAICSIEQGWSPQCENVAVMDDKQWGVLKVGSVNYGKFTPSENKALPATLDPHPELAIREGDLLISRANTTELVGSAAVAELDYGNLMLCDKLYRLQMDHSTLSPQFLCHFLNSKTAREPIELGASGASASMKNISQSVILELWFAAPSIEEQNQVVMAIKERWHRITALIEEAEQAVNLLQERRTALISAAVTGKIDVRDQSLQETA